MKLRLKILFGAVVLVIASLWLTGASPAAADDITITGHSLFDVNIRAMPGINSAVIGVLPGGREVSAIGRSPGNNWIQIQDGTTTGWVAAWLTVYSADTALLPVTTGSQPPPVGDDVPHVLRSPYNVNIRAAPDVNAKKVRVLPHSTDASAIGRNALSSWILIRYAGVEGWVAAWLVITDGDTNSLPISDGAELPPEEEPDETPPPTTPEPDDEGEDEEEEEPIESDIVVETPYRVNVRSIPNIDGKIIDLLPNGQTVPAIGRNAGNNWIQIAYGSTRGWVAAWVVIASDDTAKLTVTSSSTEYMLFEGQIIGHGVYDMIIRLGPSVEYGSFGELPAHTPVPLIERTEDSSWLKISYQGAEGWLAAWLVIANADWNNLPVAEEFSNP